MTSFLWALTIIGALIGGIVLFMGLLTASGAPQEAAAAGIALAFTVIPYCLARASSELKSDNKRKPNRNESTTAQE